MLQYKNVWEGGNDPVPSIRNDFEYAKREAFAWQPFPLQHNILYIHFVDEIECKRYLCFSQQCL